MDRFLLKRKSANEAEVEEVHVEENLAAPTTKRNNVRVFKFNEKWKDRRPWLSLEDGKMLCSYCKVFDKTSRNKFILLLILSIVKPQFNFVIAKKRKINV